VLARAFAAFSRAKLEALIERRQEEDARERAGRDEPELAQTAAIARDFFSVAFAVLAALSTSTTPGDAGWRTLAAWLAGWAVGVSVLPRVVGTSFAEPIVLWFGGAARVLLLPTRPLGKLVFLGAKVLDRLRGKPDAESEEDEIEEEIRAIVAEGTTEGLLHEREGDMIESVLSLRDADVAEIMTPRTEMVSVPVDAGLDEAIRIAREAGHSRVPVHEGTRDNIIGIFYVKDLLHHWGKEPRPAIRDIMRKPHFVPESRNVSGLMEELKRANVHIAVALDEYGGTAGIVTVEDVVEEIVGEITDEFDSKQEPTWQRLDDSTLVADARVHVDEINEELHVDMPEEEEYDTVGGLVAAVLGRIPGPGETVSAGGAEIEVVEADARRVKRVRIRRAAEAED